MCVIFVAGSRVRPTEEMVANAWAQNSDGGGIAWRENGYVRWKKGIMTLEEMKKLCAETPLPYVAHFRIPSVGGKREILCHPFPIEKNVPLDLEGRTKGNVLFHNGHWARWRDMTMEAAGRFGVPLPTGKWSDSRGMAFCASVYGVGVLEMIDEKAVAFGPTECEVFLGTGWKMINDVWCSNDFFERRGQSHFYHGTGPTRYTSVCLERTCTLEKVAGSQYCTLHKQADEMAKKALEDERVKKAAEKDKERREATSGNGGGDHKLLPFHEIDRLHKSGARNPNGALIISKNAWKRARKKFQKDQKLLMRHQAKLAKEKLSSPTLMLH